MQQKASFHKDANLEDAINGIKIASEQGANIVCLQELFLTPYIAQRRGIGSYFSLAEPIHGPTTDKLMETAKKYGVVLVGGSIWEKDGDKFYNTSVVFDNDGEILGKYRKNYIPHDPHYWEQDYFSGGDIGYQVFKTEFGNLGVLICYDQWFPEAAIGTVVEGYKKGTPPHILFYPTAIGWTERMAEREINTAKRNWVDMQRMHGVACHTYIAAVNRVGKEEFINFWGNSFVSAPDGEVISKADDKNSAIIIADCDPNKIEEAKEWRFMEERLKKLDLLK